MIAVAIDQCYFLQVARALQYMHSMQIVHRDVKPENVMIMDKPTEDGLYPQVSENRNSAIFLYGFTPIHLTKQLRAVGQCL